MKINLNKIAGMGALSAIAASLCCITPVLVLISGASGVMSAFTWMEPARPYLIGITVAVLGFAWYQKLKPKTADEILCACKEDEKPSFWQTYKFLGIITVFATLMLAFPNFASVFYHKSERQVVVVDKLNIQTCDFSVTGMSCAACEDHVNYEVSKLPGIIKSTVSYKHGNVSVKFDNSKTSIAEIEKAINGTGYKVVSTE